MCIFYVCVLYIVSMLRVRDAVTCVFVRMGVCPLHMFVCVCMHVYVWVCVCRMYASEGQSS